MGPVSFRLIRISGRAWHTNRDFDDFRYCQNIPEIGRTSIEQQLPAGQAEYLDCGLAATGRGKAIGRSILGFHAAANAAKIT